MENVIVDSHLDSDGNVQKLMVHFMFYHERIPLSCELRGDKYP